MDTKVITVKDASQAINLMATNFMESSEIDADLLSVFTRGITSEILDLRDYVLGMPADFGVGFMINFAEAVVEQTPPEFSEFSYAIKTILACYYYENVELKRAKETLDEVLETNPDYPLATLLKRVFDSGWSPESFSDMRRELHPKVIKSLQEKASLNISQ
jgi:hypothetical protein